MAKARLTVEEKEGFTVPQINSMQRIEEALRIIIALVPMERVRSSQARRKALGKAYASLSSHAWTFGVDTPQLGYFYNEEAYIAGALKIQPELLDKFVAIKNGELRKKIHAVHVRQ